MFEDTGIFLLWVAATWFVANIFIGISDALKKTNSQLEEVLTARLKQINDMVHIVAVETKGDVQYWFDRDDGEFLAQGANYAEMSTVLKERFPKHVFYFEIEDQQYIIAESTEWKPMEVQIQAVDQ